MIDEVLARFPKRRPELSAPLARVHRESYVANRTGATTATAAAQRMEAWLHRQVAADVQAAGAAKSTLEIGAGTLNQLPYEPQVGVYDVVEPFADLYRGSPLLARVRHVYGDIDEVPSSERYDRITSIATFEHICDLPRVIARAGLLLTAGGSLRAAIPSEGTPLWELGWRLTTGIEFRLRHGLDYAELMRHEHVNTAAEIDALLRHFFAGVECRVLGLSRRWSLYQFFACRDVDAARCRAVLDA